MNRRAACYLLLMASTLVGCRGPSADAQQGQLNHVRLLTMMYTKVSSQHGRNPKDEQEFKDMIRKSDVSLEAMKVSSIDELFVSERDGQPLGVVYGPAAPGSDVVVYEPTGVDGIRLVGHKLGMVEGVDEARFRELVPQGVTSPK
jgi:hypothetical protein